MEQVMLLFIQENLWTTGKGGICAVFTLPEKGVGAGLGVAGLLFSRAAPLRGRRRCKQNKQSVFWKGYI